MSFKINTRLICDPLRDNAKLHREVVAKLNKAKKGKTLDHYESQIDMICLNIALDLDLIYSRHDATLIFESR